MRKLSRSTIDAPRAGWSRPAELGTLIVVAGLSVILAGGWFALLRRVGAVERAADESRLESAGQKEELSRRLEILSGRVEGSEERLRSQRASAARLESALSRLTSGLDSLRRSREGAASAAEVNQLLATVRGLSNEVARVKRLAETAAQEPEAAPGPTPDGASAKDVAALAGRLDGLDARVAELGRKVSSLKKPQARVNEEALRAMISQMVQEEIKKAFEARRDDWRRRRQEE